LADCLPSALAALNHADHDSLSDSDGHRMMQTEYAQHRSMSRVAAQSCAQCLHVRLGQARARVRGSHFIRMTGHVCGVRPASRLPSVQVS